MADNGDDNLAVAATIVLSALNDTIKRRQPHNKKHETTKKEQQNTANKNNTDL